MYKSIAQFECNIEGKLGRFILDHDTPTTHAKEMCLQFLKFIGQIEDAYKSSQEASNQEEQLKKPEENKVE